MIRILSGKSFLVTGSTGRIGCEIVHRLENLGARVIPAVMGDYPLQPKRISWQAETAPVHIQSSKDLEKISHPDYIINLHWLVNRSLAITNQIIYEFKKNVHNLTFFWEWAKDNETPTFVNISTIKVFSHLNQNPISSSTEPKPLTPYGIAKLAAEKYFDAFFQGSEIKVVHVYLCSIASLGEHPTHLFSQLYNSAFHEKQMILNSEQLSYIFYIEEIVDLIISVALYAKENRYILTPTGIINKEIAHKFETIAKLKLNIKNNHVKNLHPTPIFLSDIKKLKQNWIRKYSTEKMIKTIISLNKTRRETCI